MTDQQVLDAAKKASQNDKGEFAMYNNGTIVGYTTLVTIDGQPVSKRLEGPVNQVKAEALKSNIHMIVDGGFRPWITQFNLRYQNVKDHGKRSDFNFLCTGDNSNFVPRTGQPGYSNHQLWNTIDWRTRDVYGHLIMENYEWMIKHMLSLGWVRTVKTLFDKDGKVTSEGERWHWSYIPDNHDMFVYVPKTDPTWDGLV